MQGRHNNFNQGLTKADYEFDARIVIGGRISPLCGMKIWLPIDCHEDAKVQIYGSSNPPEEHLPLIIEGTEGEDRIFSEIDPCFGLQIEACGINIHEVINKPDLRVLGLSVWVDHISSLKFIRERVKSSQEKLPSNEACSHICFYLSDLNYGTPKAVPKMDFLGNREAGLVHVKEIKVQSQNGVVELALERHWRWSSTTLGRVMAGNFPALVIKNPELFKWNQLDQILHLGRDICLLLSLAARHLTVVHVMNSGTEIRRLEEWFYPLNRQRSTTEEEALGPLVDERYLEEFFLCSSEKWLGFTDAKKDAIRLAVFSINPFVNSSTESRYLQRFTALEGLANVLFPETRKQYRKLEELNEAFPKCVSGLWPLIDKEDDGLNIIRHRLAHGDGMQGEFGEALVVADDHLQVWVERILLELLGCGHLARLSDQLVRQVQVRAKDLPRLRALVRKK